MTKTLPFDIMFTGAKNRSVEFGIAQAVKTKMCVLDRPTAFAVGLFFVSFKEVEMEFKFNEKNKADGLELLSVLENCSVGVVFFDPQYKGILDKMNYGQHRMKKRYELFQMSEETIKTFIQEIDRVLKKSGYVFLWVDKFHLCSGISDWIDKTELRIVDMITWNKERIGMGYRTRRVSEYCLVLQKEPVKAKTTWKIHNIPDVWNEKSTKDHPHNKPVELQKQLILATTCKDDIVLDPASGGYSVLKACQLAERKFLGCDLGGSND